MFMDNLLPVSPVCTKPDLSPLRRGRFRGGHNLAHPTDTCPLPTPQPPPYHGCRSGPCHIAGPNQDQPLRPVTCRDQTPLQPRILQPFLACCRCPKMVQNGTEFENSGFSARRLQALPIIAAAPTLAQAARSSGIGQDAPYRWLQDRRFRHELTRLRPETADLARYELQGLMLPCSNMSTYYLTPTIPSKAEESQIQRCLPVRHSQDRSIVRSASVIHNDPV